MISNQPQQQHRRASINNFPMLLHIETEEEATRDMNSEAFRDITSKLIEFLLNIPYTLEGFSHIQRSKETLSWNSACGFSYNSSARYHCLNSKKLLSFLKRVFGKGNASEFMSGFLLSTYTSIALHLTVLVGIDWCQITSYSSMRFVS